MDKGDIIMSDGRFEPGHEPYNKGKKRSELTKLKIQVTKLEQENKKLKERLKCQNSTEEKNGLNLIIPKNFFETNQQYNISLCVK
jgi:hypothetical protein